MYLDIIIKGWDFNLVISTPTLCIARNILPTSHMFGTVDNIFTAGFDDMGKDHDATLNNFFRICRQANLKLNNNK